MQKGLRQSPRASGKLTSSARWMPQSFRSSTAAHLLCAWAGADRELCRAPIGKRRGGSAPLCWFLSVPPPAIRFSELRHPIRASEVMRIHELTLRPKQAWALHALPYMWMQCDEQAPSLMPRTAPAHSQGQRRSACSGHCDVECLSTARPASSADGRHKLWCPWRQGIGHGLMLSGQAPFRSRLGHNERRWCRRRLGRCRRPWHRTSISHVEVVFSAL